MRLSATLTVLFALATYGPAHAVLVAGWTFETSVPTTAGPHAAELGVNAGSSSPATGFHTSTATAYSNPAGNGSLESFSSTNWAIGDYYQFRTSTVGYQDASFSFDAASSNTGPRDFQVQYSTNGTTFTPLATYSVLANAAPNPVWNSATASSIYGFSFDLPAALDNQSSIFLRLVNSSNVSANGGTVAAAGASRVDNVMIEAAAIPEPSAFLFGALVCCVVGAAVAGRRIFARNAAE